MKKDIKTISAEEFDKMFDEGDERYLDYVDFENAVRLGDEQQKISISLPTRMLKSLDDEAERIGVTRQSIIKIWLDEKLRTQTA